MAECNDYVDVVRRELGGVIALAQAKLQSLGEFLFVISAIECITITNNNEHFSQKYNVGPETIYEHSFIHEYRQYIWRGTWTCSCGGNSRWMKKQIYPLILIEVVVENFFIC